MNTKAPFDRQLLQAFVDGELDLAAQIDVETRLEADAGARAEVEQLRVLRSALREQADYHGAPTSLRRRLAGSAAPFSGAPSRPQASRSWRDWLAWRPLGTGFAAACVLLWAIGIASSSLPWVKRSNERLAEEVIASHVRSTIGERLVDVASSDRHTVKPWLSARLDFSPPVADVPVPGATFLGGRVDYLAGHPVATLVYKQRQHVIDVFVWPEGRTGESMHSLSDRGFNTIHWSRGGMRYWMVSDLNRDELSAFAQALDKAAAAL